MTSEQFDALAVWIDRRQRLTAKIERACEQRHDRKSIAKLYQRRDEADAEARAVLVSQS